MCKIGRNTQRAVRAVLNEAEEMKFELLALFLRTSLTVDRNKTSFDMTGVIKHKLSAYVSNQIKPHQM